MQTIKFRKYLYKPPSLIVLSNIDAASKKAQRSGRQVYRKNVVGGASWKYYGCAACGPAGPLITYAVQGFMRQVLVVISYVSRRTSCLCLPRTVCMYTRQTVLRMTPAFSSREASNDSTLLSHPQKINIRDLENRCESTLSRDSTHGIYNEVARCICVPVARLGRLKQPK